MVDKASESLRRFVNGHDCEREIVMVIIVMTIIIIIIFVIMVSIIIIVIVFVYISSVGFEFAETFVGTEPSVVL